MEDIGGLCILSEHYMALSVVEYVCTSGACLYMGGHILYHHACVCSPVCVLEIERVCCVRAGMCESVLE